MEALEVNLSYHKFFEGLAPQYLQLLAGCASEIRVNAGDFFFREGGSADQFFLILHGKVAIQMCLPGRCAITVETLGESDVLGWSWLMTPYRWHFDAQAIELTRAIAFDARCIRSKCEASHDLGYELMKRFASLMTERLEAARFQLADVYGSYA